jgi:hypothetical protein
MLMIKKTLHNRTLANKIVKTSSKGRKQPYSEEPAREQKRI